MILSQKRIDELLTVFENPKSMIPYDNSKEKEELKNATIFINNYHIYGRPPIYNTKTMTIPYKSTNQIENISRKQTFNSKDNSFVRKITKGNKKLNNYKDLEIQKSIENLKSGKEEYLKQQPQRSIKKPNTEYYKTNNYSTISYVSEYEKNQKIYSSLLNSTSLAKTIYLSDNNYNEKTINQRLFNSSRLKDIPSEPDDVIIQEHPENYIASMNPISSSHFGYGVSMNNNISNLAITQNNVGNMNEALNEPPKIIEEINTDLIPKEETKENEQVEETAVEEKKEEEKKEEIPPEKPAGKYVITALNGPVTLPEGYSTNDEEEYKAIQFLNEDLSTWKLQIDKPNVKVYSKLYKIKNENGEEDDNIMFHTDVTIDFPASEVIRQLNTFELRKKWEKSLEKGKLIKEEDLGNNLSICEYYSYIKMPFIFSDRDMVLRKKIWNDYQGEKDCCLCQIQSMEHPDFPAKEKPVRAEFENRGEYIKPIDANKCRFSFATKFDMKLSVGVSMMEGKGSEGQEKWVKEFLKQLGK